MNTGRAGNAPANPTYPTTRRYTLRLLLHFVRVRVTLTQAAGLVTVVVQSFTQAVSFEADHLDAVDTEPGIIRCRGNGEHPGEDGSEKDTPESPVHLGWTPNAAEEEERKTHQQ